MKKSAYVRFSITLLLVFSMLSPMAVLAIDGKKHFKEGKKAEDAEQWDKAVEEYALAITDSPKNPEYLLHYRRSLFMASQMFMRRGTSLALDKDYAGGYLAFRKSYAYDPTNELAKSEMERMLRLQQAVENGDKPDAAKNTDGGVKLVPTDYRKPAPQDNPVPQKLEKLRDVPFPSGVNLPFLIRELAKDLDLNVLFDAESRLDDLKVKIELKNVTAAKALDYVFLQQNLFFQKVGPRTILVAAGNRRQNFQQLVLRTFYLSNADPKDVQKVIQGAIPAQPGRTPTTSIIDEDTNSITIRDTQENIRIIGRLISSLDKDRAEVVMDVAIYEVSKSDLLKLGNQIGTEGSLTNFGGTTAGVIGNGSFNPTTGSTAASIIPRAFGVGLVIPAINLVAFQSRGNAKLLASTQIHAFNNEDSSARIGQRVPVQTAQLLGYNNNTGTGTGNNFNNSQAASVYNYEQVGLTLKFKPIVFPNQDVQVAMEIESKDVVAGGLNPTFSERTIKGTARIQNNKTLLLASAASNVESSGRQGLPLLGLIPILGRLFTAPTKENRQVDIVIAVTPRVIRAPAILPEDEIERPTGSLAVPTSGSLEALIIQEEMEENLAAARRIPTVAQVQMPDQPVVETPTYTKSNATQTVAAAEQKSDTQTPITSQPEKSETAANNQQANSIIANLRPIDTSVKTLQIGLPVDSSENKVETRETSLKAEEEKPKAAEAKTAEEVKQPNTPLAQLQFLTNLPEMKTGEKTKIAVMVKSATAFRSAVLGLQFDPKKIAVRSVGFGDVFGAGLAQTQATPFMNQNGKTFVSLSSPKDIAENTSGILAYIEVEALADGKHEITFDKEVLNFLTADGKNFVVKY
jgi:general secretion pathway protein D